MVLDTWFQAWRRPLRRCRPPDTGPKGTGLGLTQGGPWRVQSPQVSEDLMTLPPVISERFTGWRDVSPEDIERLTSVDTPAAKQSGPCFRIVVPAGNNPRDGDAGCCPLRPCDGNAQRTQPRSKPPPQRFRTLAANSCQRPVDARGGNPIEWACRENPRERNCMAWENVRRKSI